MKISNLFILFIFCLLSLTSNAQEVEDYPNHEVGIRLASLRDYAFMYKKEYRANRKFRLRSAYTTLSGQADVGTNVSLGFQVGHEWLIPLKREKTSLYHAVEIGAGWAGSFNSNNDRQTLRTGLAYLIGWQVNVAPRFTLSLELGPSLNVTFAESQNAKIDLSASTANTGLTALYRL